MSLSVKHLISLKDLTKEDFDKIFVLSAEIKKNPKNYEKALDGQTLAMVFEKSSTRTRVSFETGMTQLGGHAIFLGKNDIQMGRGEIISDTAKTLSAYVDLIMARTFEHKTVEELAKNSNVPVINGLTGFNHPCQILADLLTIREIKGEIDGLKIAWVGDGNNVCHSFIHASEKLGFDFIAATPKGYEPKVKCKITDNPKTAVNSADVIVTDTWVSMGDEKEKKKRIKIFKGFTVDSKLSEGAKKDFIFLHCLPAYRGKEVSGEIIDGKHSKVWQEAENRLHVQKAVMILLAND